jgi:hypothetical protein
MHLGMRDNQTGPKIGGLAPAYMARLPPSIIRKNIFVSSKRPMYTVVCQLGLCTPTYIL